MVETYIFLAGLEAERIPFDDLVVNSDNMQFEGARRCRAPNSSCVILKDAGSVTTEEASRKKADTALYRGTCYVKRK